jgi:hypothetical protein
MNLTFKERLFIEAYLGPANGNGSEAARIAGYAHPGKLAYQLLQKTRIRTAIDARLSVVAMATNEVLARLSEFAAGSLEPFIEIDESGEHFTINLKSARKAGALRLIKRLRAGKHGPEIEIHSRLDALEKLARYYGLFSNSAHRFVMLQDPAAHDVDGNPVEP